MELMGSRSNAVMKLVGLLARFLSRRSRRSAP